MDTTRLDLDGKPFCPTGSAQRYHDIGECECRPLTVSERLRVRAQLEPAWQAHRAAEAVGHDCTPDCLSDILRRLPR